MAVLLWKYWESLVNRVRYASLSKAEARIRDKTSGETVVVFTIKGSYMFSRSESTSRIVFTKQEADLMRNCIVTHNHPQDTPPGDSDVRSACAGEWQEMRVVTRTRTYVAGPPASGWNLNFWNQTINPSRLSAEVEIIASLAETGQAETLSASEYQTAILNYVWTRVANETGMVYTVHRRRGI